MKKPEKQKSGREKKTNFLLLGLHSKWFNSIGSFTWWIVSALGGELKGRW
jgi:hypothetical protein